MAQSFRRDEVANEIKLDEQSQQAISETVRTEEPKIKDKVLRKDDNLISQLITIYSKEWARFTNHVCVERLAKGGSANDKYFKEYLKQDYYYLHNLIRFRAARLAKFRSDANSWTLDLEIKKITSANETAKAFRNLCLGMAKNQGVWTEDLARKSIASTKEELDSPDGPGVAVLGYNSFLQDRVSLDDWFTLYIATIPCLYGYGLIASKYTDGADKNSLFYKLWIEPNAGYNSSNALYDLFAANQRRFESEATKKYWASVFSNALKFEIALFDSVCPPA